MHFNEYLKTCREKNHLTQEQLSHELYSYDIDSFDGVFMGTISKWERGIITPHLSRQVSIIKYFQQKSGNDLPCWEGYSDEEVESLISHSAMQNFIGKRKHYMLDFPSNYMKTEDIKVYPIRKAENRDALLEINMDLHMDVNHIYTQVRLEQFKEWAMHSSNLFLVCEYKKNILGLFFSLRLKQESFEKIMNFEMKKSDITSNDFASFDEMGTNFMLSFYALNQKVSTMLFVRYYAHLISNQKVIEEIGD